LEGFFTLVDICFVSTPQDIRMEPVQVQKNGSVASEAVALEPKEASEIAMPDQVAENQDKGYPACILNNPLLSGDCITNI